MNKEFTATQVAERFGVDVGTVYLWLKAGLFPNAYRKAPIPRSPYIIPESDVLSFEKRRHESVGINA